MSTDSDSIRASRSSRRRSSKRDNAPVSTRVESLASSLQDTNRNLREVDRMLGEYKDAGEQQTVTVNRLKHDLARSSERLNDEKHRRKRDLNSSRSLRPSDLEDEYTKDRRRRGHPTSPLRDYDRAASDYEYEQFDGKRSYAPRSRANVRFYDDMDADESMHQLHQSLRDVSSDQIRLEEELTREIRRRNREERDSRGAIQELLESTRQPKLEQTVNSVEKRLQSIQDELKNERHLMRRKNDEVGKVSTELKQALDQQKSMGPVEHQQALELENHLRTKLADTETSRAKVETELEKTRRKLDLAEGSKDALINQVDDLRRQLTRSEEENQHLKRHLHQHDQDTQTRLKTKSLEEQQENYREQEISRLQREIMELREQLTKSASVVGDYGDLSQRLEKSERQRTQLSDHIQVLNHDLESKEKHTAKVITQLQDTNERLEDSNRQKRQLLTQLEDTLKKLHSTTTDGESLARELQESQRRQTDSDNKREEIKAKAQETVRQWKLKCKKLERDADRQKHTAEQATTRGDQLLKELEMLRAHSGTSSQQLDHIKREFSELLAIRAQQDEQVRLKDVQVNELKSLKMDLEKDVGESRMVIERLEHELQSSHDKTQRINEDKNRLEESLSASHQAQFIAENQLAGLQKEVQELALHRVEMSAQLAEMANERQELRMNLQDARRGETQAREEVEGLMQRLQQEKEMHSTKVEALKSERDQYKTQETIKVQELSRRYKKERAEYEAELQALKVDQQEDKSTARLLKRQVEKLKREMDRLSNRLAESQDVASQEQQNYLKIREEFITKAQLTEDGLSRAKTLELELLDAKEKMRRMEHDNQNLLHLIAMDIDSAIEVMTADTVDTYRALSLTKGLSSQPQKWLAEVRSKVEWIKSEFRERRDKESRMKTDVREALHNNEKDCKVLIAEIHRQTEALDQMSLQPKYEAPPVQEEVAIPMQEVIPASIQGCVEQDTEYVGSSADREHDVDTHTAALLQEAQCERDQIEERYSRLQNTMQSLRQELFDTRLYSDLHQSEPSSKTPPRSPASNRKSSRRVRITSPRDKPSSQKRSLSLERDSSFAFDPNETPISSLEHHKSPSALSLSDETFAHKFLPDSPQITSTPARERNQRRTMDDSFL